MKYTILIYESEADFGARTAGARKDAYGGAYRAYTQALTEAGVMVGGAPLQPAPRHDDPAARRQASRPGRAVRRGEGTARRLR